MVSCRVVRPAQPSEAVLLQVKAIYLESFPPDELEPFEGIVHDVVAGRALLYVADRSDEIVGFALTLPLRMRATAYLAYLAVRRDLRGQGVGAHLFRFVLEEPARSGGTTALLWEVERPIEGAPPEDPRRRRIAFYQREGGILLDAVGGYRMLRTAGVGTIPAQLMWATAIVRPPLTLSEVRQCILEVYRVKYGLGLNDPLVREVLASVRVG